MAKSSTSTSSSRSPAHEKCRSSSGKTRRSTPYSVYRPRARERVGYLALAAPLAEFPVGELRDHAPPEAERAGIAGLLGYGPLAGISREDQHCRAAADAAVPEGFPDEEFAQAEIPLRVGRRGEAPLHDREADRLLLAQHDEGLAAVVVEPALYELADALAGDGERGIDAGRVGGQVRQVFAVSLFDPVAIGLRRAGFANGDRHSVSRKGNGRGKSRYLRAIRPAVQAKQQSLTATEESLPSAHRREPERQRPQRQCPPRQRRRPKQRQRRPWRQRRRRRR